MTSSMRDYVHDLQRTTLSISPLIAGGITVLGIVGWMVVCYFIGATYG